MAATRMPAQMKAVADVLAERDRQDERWGKQHAPSDWVMLAVLTEEVGEVARALLTPTSMRYDRERLREELVQVAAVTVRWMELIANDDEHGL